MPKHVSPSSPRSGFFSNKENLLLFGKTGEGKTHLAVALGRRLCAEGIQTTFMPVNLLFEEVSAARAVDGYLKLLRKLNKSKALILDDFGPRAYTHEEATVLVDLLEDRNRNGVVIVTSQVDPRGWLSCSRTPSSAKPNPNIRSIKLRHPRR